MPYINDQPQTKIQTNVLTLKLLYLSLSLCVLVCAGVTQERIDECRGAKEAAMLADIRALVQSGADLNTQDDNGATLVRHTGHVWGKTWGKI